MCGYMLNTLYAKMITKMLDLALISRTFNCTRLDGVTRLIWDVMIDFFRRVIAVISR